MQLRRAIWRDQQGMALFATFLMLLLVLSLGAASLLQSTIDLRATSHFRTGVQALMAAESGALHGLSSINQHGGVFDFKTEVVDKWAGSTTLLGPGKHTMLSDPTAGYSVTVEADATDPQNFGYIVGSGWAPLQAARVVALRVQRSALAGSPGAIYVFEDKPITLTPKGNDFYIHGEDHYADGTIRIGGSDAPAVSTRNDAVAQKIIDSINASGRADQFTGLGLVPSVMATGGPTVDDVNKVIHDILAKTTYCPAGAPAANCTYQNNKQVFNNSATDFLSSMSSANTPMVMELTNTNGVSINGNLTGYGILIVDGPLNINGSIDFKGLIIARKGFQNSTLNGNATIQGSLWTNAQDLVVGGSLTVDYSVQALQFANSAGLGGGLGGNLPKVLVVISWDQR
jgi:hypothetical protein